MTKNLLLASIFAFTFFIINAQIDTSGYQSWRPLYNSMKTWDDGAFNMNQKGHPDYGWGIYNSITHGLSGDSIFLIKLQDGSFKQILIEEKNSVGNIYTFRYADIAGANQVIEQARCVDYTGKLFLYYSLQNKTFVDRDPANGDWDMVLTKFTDTAINYTVTGFLLNEKSKVSVLHAANATAALNSGLNDTTTFKSDLCTIGNSWYKLSGMSIVPLDTMVYFVKTPNLDIYKMQVTFFESGASGKGKVGIVKQKLHPTIGDVMRDTLIMGSGYVNDIYLSMSLGITKESSRATWDIAFKTNAYSASIITNSTKGIALYTYPKADVDAWLGLSAPSARIETTSVYPNPARDFITFSNSNWEQNSEVQLMVYNTAGKLVMNQNHSLNGNSFNSNLTELAEGLYHARILNKGNYSNAKILVTR
jgi:hypothetical protein